MHPDWTSSDPLFSVMLMPMSRIEKTSKTTTDDLAHGTYKHIKVTLSAVFTFANARASMTE
jgi:hypothetical protein